MMMRRSKKKNHGDALKRALVSVFIFFSMMLSLYPQPAHADVWGAAWAATFMGKIMDQIQRSLEGALLGTLKMAAIKMLNSKVGQLVGGASGGTPLFITNFDDFLYQGPKQKADLYMNDFFSLSTRGKGSSANYISAGTTSNKSIADNYVGMMQSAAKGSTTERIDVPTYDLDQYTSNPDEMFSSGDFRSLNAFFSNPANNTFGYTLAAERAYQNKLEMERQLATVKATASGFLPGEQNGSVTAPAGAIEAAITNVQDLGNKMIAAAENPGEILSGAVSAMANKLISNMIQKGVGEVQQKISKSIDEVDNKISSQINDATNQFGPAAQFISKNNQNTNVSIKPGTPVPPAPTSTPSCSEKQGTCVSSDLSCDPGENTVPYACGSSAYKCCL